MYNKIDRTGEISVNTKGQKMNIAKYIIFYYYESDMTK